MLSSWVRIEGSKAWSKAFMRRHGIPTADFKVFTDYQQAAEYVQQVRTPWPAGRSSDCLPVSCGGVDR